MKLKSAVPVRDAPWRHHWHTRATWNIKRNRWEARILPGLVNALPATVHLSNEDWPRFAIERFTALGMDLDAESADIPLTDLPSIPITSFRSIGTEVLTTDTAEDVPEFFRLLGVVDSTKIDLTGDLLDLSALNAPTSARLLRATDLVLHVDRPASATQWTTSAGVDGTLAQFALTVVQKPNARRAAYITTTSRWNPPEARADLLAGDVADSPTDEYLVATVFLLSPDGASPGTEIDGVWTPYVQHHEGFFWNCRHAINQPLHLAEQNLTLNTGLAGGVGDAANNFILSQINDANSAAAQFLAKGRLTSLLWTV